MSQVNQIQKYLEENKIITLPVARKLFQCERLAARINDLRNKGLDIETKIKKTRSGKRVAEYILH